MARNPVTPSKTIFHPPMLLDWTDEKLQALSQEQLLNLLDNLDRQRAIGRVSEPVAKAIDQRITALLTVRNSTRRRKQLAGIALAASADT